MILIEILIFLSTFLPIFHLINALKTKRAKTDKHERARKFSIMVPCYNEEKTVLNSIRGLLRMDYKNYEAIYINDGSTDNTMLALHENLTLKLVNHQYPSYSRVKAVYRSQKYHNIFVIDQINSGKSSALNTSLKYANADLIITLDADSILSNDALFWINDAFMDNSVVAAGGAIHITQGYSTKKFGKRSILVLLQILEYLKGFYIYKLSLAKQNATAIISGAFGAFRKEILDAVDGFRDSLGEDIDITMRIQRYIQNTDKKIIYIPEALCYTQCPDTLRNLIKQRIRWQKGFIDCAIHQMRFLLKTFLFKSISFHFFVEAFIVGCCSCLFTITSYLVVLIFSFIYPEILYLFLLYYFCSIVFGIIHSVCAISISMRYHRYPRQTTSRLVIAVILDVLVYRYFSIAMYLSGTLLYFWNKDERNNWNKIARSIDEYDP